MFLVRSKLSITAYLLLVLYRSTSLKPLPFLKNIETFLCKQKLVNTRSIPSTQQPYNHDSFSKILRPSTALQSRSFLKQYQEHLCKQKIVNNHSIPSMHTERQITNLFVKHSFTLHPSLRPYRQTELRTEKQIHSLRVGWRNFLSSCAVVSFFGFWREIGFGVTYLRIQSTIQLWRCVSFLVLAGNSFWYCIRTQCTTLAITL